MEALAQVLRFADIEELSIRAEPAVHARIGRNFAHPPAKLDDGNTYSVTIGLR